MSTPALHIRAEQAVLGAVLHEPQLLDRLDGQIDATVWERPYHRQVWQAMSRIRAREEMVSPRAVAAEVATNPDVHGDATHVVNLAELMEAAPQPRHAAYYARMVTDAHVRREVMTVGRRLAQVAADPHGETADRAREQRDALGPLRERHYGPAPRPLTTATTPDQRQTQLDNLLAQADQLRARAETAPEPERAGLLSELANLLRQLFATVMEMQWRPMPAHPDQQHIGARALAAKKAQAKHNSRGEDAGEQPAEAEEEMAPRTFEAGPVTALAPAGPGVDAAEDAREQAERQLLAALAADPSVLDATADLTSDQWADTWRRDVWTLAHGLRAAGQPIDALTLTWAAQQAGLAAPQPAGDQIPIEEITSTLGGGYIDGRTHARDIGDHAMRIGLTQAADHALTAADDPTTDITNVMDDLDTTLARITPGPETTPEVTVADLPEQTPAQTRTGPVPEPAAEPEHPVTLAEQTAVLQARGYTPQVAQQGAREQIEHQRTQRPPLPQIDPDAPVDVTARLVLARIQARGARLDAAQVDRVLQEHYHLDGDKAGQVAEQVTQLGQPTKPRIPEAPARRLDHEFVSARQ